MKILFWVPYPHEGASNRFRVEQFIPSLKKENFESALHPFWSNAAFKILYKKGNYLKKITFFLAGAASRLWDILRISGYDVVFIHREAFPLGSYFFESAAKAFKKPVIFDFDDAIFLPFTSPQNNFIERFKRSEKVAELIKLSDCVIAGNDYLAEFALRHNRNVSVIPTSVDLDKYYPVARDAGKKVTIGWIGSITTTDFLEQMRGVFTKLSRRFPHVEFKIVGGNFGNGKIPGVICVPWSLEEEVEQLRTFDIGIMPMPDNEWTRGKCGFKAILYMSMSIPSVCSPVGMNKEIITDGVNGYLAHKESEWIEKLALLVERPDLRKKMGNEARKTVEEKYSLKVSAPKFLAVLKEAYHEKV